MRKIIALIVLVLVVASTCIVYFSTTITPPRKLLPVVPNSQGVHIVRTRLPGRSPLVVTRPPLQGVRAPDRQGTMCVPGQWKWADDGRDVIYNDNTFSPTGAAFDQECIQDPGDGPGFYVSKSTTPTFAWNAYPAIFSGCEYSVCSKHSPLPIQVSAIKSFTMTNWTRYALQASGNDAVDAWFTPTGTLQDVAHGHAHPSGAEMMEWLTERNEPPGLGANINLGPAVGIWYLTVWRDCTPANICWNYIQWRRTGIHKFPSVTNLDQTAFLHYGETHRLAYQPTPMIQPNWYLTAWASGFEMVQRGVGNAILNFSLCVNGLDRGKPCPR